MDKAVEKIEQIIISAMTNDGEYKVEDVGEHATEIAKALIFNGYRLPPKEEDLPLLSDEEIKGICKDPANWYRDQTRFNSWAWDDDKIRKAVAKAQRHLIAEYLGGKE